MNWWPPWAQGTDVFWKTLWAGLFSFSAPLLFAILGFAFNRWREVRALTREKNSRQRVVLKLLLNELVRNQTGLRSTLDSVKMDGTIGHGPMISSVAWDTARMEYLRLYPISDSIAPIDVAYAGARLAERRYQTMETLYIDARHIRGEPPQDWDALMENLAGRLEIALEQQQEALQAISDATELETSQVSEQTDKS